MDRREYHRFIKIRPPQEMLNRVVKKIDVWKDERVMMEQALKSKDVPTRVKIGIAKVLDSGEMRNTNLEIDKKAEDELVEWYDTKIKSAIDRGDIPKPVMDSKMRHYYEQATQGSGDDGSGSGGSKEVAPTSP